MRVNPKASLAIITVLLLSGCANSTGVAGAGTKPSASPSSVPLAALRDTLLAEAQRFGEASPKTLLGVQTTRRKALALSDPGESVSSAGVDTARQRVYLLEATGLFHGALGEKMPSGAHPPDGSTLSMIIDATTLDILDLGLTDAHDDLATLGSVFRL